MYKVGVGMTKYADIPEFGQFVEYITQAPAIDGFCDVIINQVDLSEQPIIEAAEVIKADYEKVSALRTIPKLTADKVEKIKQKIEAEYCFDVATLVTWTDDPLLLVGTLCEVKQKEDWKSGVLYHVGDVRLYAKNLFRCTVQHTSTLLLAPDKAKDKWEKYYDATPALAVWAVGVFYPLDFVVSFKSKVYRCLIAHTSTLALDPEKAKTYWVEVK
jgi:hypothetical protein